MFWITSYDTQSIKILVPLNVEMNGGKKEKSWWRFRIIWVFRVRFVCYKPIIFPQMLGAFFRCVVLVFGIFHLYNQPTNRPSKQASNQTEFEFSPISMCLFLFDGILVGILLCIFGSCLNRALSLNNAVLLFVFMFCMA